MTDGRYELPQGWTWATIGDVVQAVDQLNPGATPTAEYRYVDVSSISNRDFEIASPKVVIGAEAPSRARQAIRPGDVLFSTVRPYLRNIALVRNETDGNVGSTAFSVLRSNGSVDPGYLFRWTLTKQFLDGVVSRQRGISYPAVRDADVLDQMIPLAPLGQQRRIVAKIEKLLEQSRTAREALDRIPLLLGKFRQAVLAAAFRGDLTRDWRDHHADVGPAKLLIERIRPAGSSPARSIGKREMPPAGASNMGELPATWAWSFIGELFEVKPGGTPSRKKPAYWNGTILWVSSGEVAFERIGDTREKITEEGLQNSNAKVHPAGTVLLAMIGEGKTRGQAAILDSPAATNQNVAAILCAGSSIPSEYVFWWLRYHYEETRSLGEGGAQPALNARKVRAIPIPVAPQPEQEQIIKGLEVVLGRADAIEAAVAAARARADELEQSVLARAFRGELVSPEPTGEAVTATLADPAIGRGA